MPTPPALTEFDDFTFIQDGRAEYPIILFDGDVEALVEVPFGSPVPFLSFTDENTVAIINDDVNGGITSGGEGFVAMLITPTVTISDVSSATRIGLFGPNTHLILNAGTIDMDVAFGMGQDAMFNFGALFGEVSMGGGDDFFINDSFDTEGLYLEGGVFASVYMGSGDDTVLNGATMGNVFLGQGDDFYAAITPQSVLDNFNNPLVSAGTIRAGGGDDKVFGGANDDVIFGQSGNDTLNGHGGDDFISGGNNKDKLNGGNGEDTLNGGNGKDVLQGGRDDDVLRGGNGADRLIGGHDDDTLTGGTGDDVFVMNGRSGDDVITDFDIDDDVVQLQQVFTLVGSEGEGFVETPAITFAAIEALLDYSGDDATLNLRQLYIEAGLVSETNGESATVTFLDVADGSLTADNFLLV